MKDFKFKSNPKLDSLIQSILASSKFSSFQEYIESKIKNDYTQINKNKKID